MKENFTIMLPVNRNNLKLANNCINHLLENSDINIIVIDDNGHDHHVVHDKFHGYHNDHYSEHGDDDHDDDPEYDEGHEDE